MLILIILFTILFSFVVWKNPLFGLQLNLFALPAYLIRFKIGIPFTLLEVMILVNFSFWFFRNFSTLVFNLKQRVKKIGVPVEYPFAIEMILLLLAGIFGTFVAGLTNEAFGIWKAYFFEPVLLAIVIYNIIGKLELNFIDKTSKIVQPLAMSAIIISLVAIYQKQTGNLIDNSLWQASETRRVVSVFGYPNAVGLYLETIIIYSFGLLLLKFKNTKKSIADNFELELYLTTIILSVLAISFAKSTGAFFGLLVGLSVVSILYSKVSRLVWLALVIAISASIFVGGFQRDKTIAIFTLTDFSGQVRKIGWSETIKMLKDGRVFTGAGLSNYQQAVTKYHAPGFYFNKNNESNFQAKLHVYNQKFRDKYWQPLEVYMYPHNIFLNFWSEIGLAGLLIIVWILGKFYFVSIKLLQKNDILKENKLIIIMVIGAMSTIIAHGMVDVPFFKNDLSVLFWLPILLLGLLIIEQKIKALNLNATSSKIK